MTSIMGEEAVRVRWGVEPTGKDAGPPCELVGGLVKIGRAHV